MVTPLAGHFGNGLPDGKGDLSNSRQVDGHGCTADENTPSDATINGELKGKGFDTKRPGQALRTLAGELHRHAKTSLTELGNDTGPRPRLRSST